MLFIEPCLPTISRTVPTGVGWAYEIKHDGFRFLCLRDDSACAPSHAAAKIGASSCRRSRRRCARSRLGR